MPPSQHIEDLAIVLRSQAFGERDKLVTLLSEHHGKVSGVAKGAIHSRRYGGSLDLFTCSSVRWKTTQGELVRIDEANVRRDFLRIRNRLENLSAAGHFTDLCLRLTENGNEARELFLLLAHYLKLLEEHAASFEIVRSFEIKLLARLGWAPVLEHCVACEAPFFGRELPPEESTVSLAVDRGGFLCHACQRPGSTQFSLASLLWMIQARETLIQHTPTLHFPLSTMMDAAGALQHFLRWHCPGLGNYEFRAQKMLEGFLLEAHQTPRE